MGPGGVLSLPAELLLEVVKDLPRVFMECLGDGLHIEGLVVAFLKHQGGEAEEISGNGGHIQHGDALRGGAQALLRADGDPTQEAANGSPLGHLGVASVIVPNLVGRGSVSSQEITSPAGPSSFLWQCCSTQGPVDVLAWTTRVRQALRLSTSSAMSLEGTS